MSLDLIGYENLPNAFIEKIEILDYNKTRNALVFSVSVHDLIDESIWSDTEEIFNQMIRVGFIVSTDSVEINSLINGSLNPLKAKKLYTKNIDKHTSIEESKIYKFNFSETVETSTQNLSVFSFCFIDKKQILEKMSINVPVDYVGPIKCEKIIENGNLITTSHAFVRKNGTLWAGPVHQHADGFMIGSYHKDQPHESLTKIEVSNTKIRDLRNLVNSSNSRKQEKSSFVSDIFMSKNNNIDINCIFMINFAALLKEKSLFGKFLSSVQQNVLNELIADLTIKSFSVIRQRVSRDRLKNKKIFNQKNILTTYDSEQGLQKISRFERNGSFNIIEDSLRSESDVNYIVGKNEIFIEHLSDFKKIATIKEVFLQYGIGIRSFQFNDHELSYNTFGEYQYKIELIMSDPTRQFLLRTITKIEEMISEIKNYSVFFKNKKLENFDLDLTSIINEYIKIYSYLYEMSQAERTSMVFKLRNMLNKKTTNLQSINKVLKLIEKLYSDMLSFLRFDKNLKNLNKKVSIMSKENTINVITLNHQFTQSFTPSDNEISLSYIDDSVNDFIKVMTKDEMNERADQEIGKNFLTDPKFDTNLINRDVISGLGDIRTFRTSYLSPVALNDRDLQLDLKNNYNVPFDQFNRSMNRRSGPREDANLFSVNKPQSSTQEMEEDDGEAFVESSKTFGRSSEFVRYSENLEDYNVIEDSLKVEESLENISNPIDVDRSVPDVFAGIKEITPEEAVSLPSQIKSVLNTFNNSTVMNYIDVNKDGLSKAETRNYFEVNNFSLQQVMILKGFMLDRNLNIAMNKPIFATLTQSELDNLQDSALCILRRYTNNKFKITDQQRLSISNSIFIISDQNIETRRVIESIRTPIYNMEQFSYEFLNSEVVVQRNQAVDDRSSTSGTMTSNTVATSTNTGGY